MGGVSRRTRRIQLGAETTAGTAVDATLVWRGPGGIVDNTEVTFVEEDVGYLGGVDHTLISKVEAQLDMDEVAATFEQLPYILDAGVITTTATTTGAGSGYIWAYSFPTTAANAIQTYTIEAGDGTQAEEFAYGFVSEFELSGSSSEPVNMTATWIGRQVSTTTFTTALTFPEIDEAIFNKTLLYIDDATTSPATTLKSQVLLGYDLKVDTGWRPVYTADGEIYFSFIKNVGPEITLDVTFEHDSTATAEKAAWLAETARLIRLAITGPALTTTGTAYSTKMIIVDLAGKWESFDKIDEQDGNDIIKGTFRARYVPTPAAFASITVVNETSAL